MEIFEPEVDKIVEHIMKLHDQEPHDSYKSSHLVLLG